MSSPLKDTDVLVTGGNGFIGSNLVRRLIKEEANVHVFSLNNNNLNDIKGKIKFYRIDIKNYDDVKSAIEKISPEKIFHLASVVSLSRDIKDMELIVNTKITGTMNIIKALENVDYDCFVNTGTCEEYGNNNPPFREDMLPMPISPYSAANVSMTFFCKMLYDTNGLPITTLRLFTCYGPYQKPVMLIPYVIRSVIEGNPIRMTKGEQKRDFNYIDDTIKALILSCKEKKSIGEIINIGTGKSHRISDVVNKIINMMRMPVKASFGDMPYRKPEIWDLRADNSKAKKLINWEPETSLETGLKKTIDWYKMDAGIL